MKREKVQSPRNIDNGHKHNLLNVENVESPSISPKTSNASPISLSSTTNSLLFGTPKRQRITQDIVINPRKLSFDGTEE